MFGGFTEQYRCPEEVKWVGGRKGRLAGKLGSRRIWKQGNGTQEYEVRREKSPRSARSRRNSKAQENHREIRALRETKAPKVPVHATARGVQGDHLLGRPWPPRDRLLADTGFYSSKRERFSNMLRQSDNPEPH